MENILQDPRCIIAKVEADLISSSLFLAQGKPTIKVVKLFHQSTF
jgi:hypothetical protein